MISILTLNIQGLRALSSRQTLMSWINCFLPDIVCLQETHSISEDEFSSWFVQSNLNISNKFNYQCVSSPGRVRSCGVAVLFKSEFEVLNSVRDNEGRFVAVDFCHNGFSFQVACLYGPNTKKPAQAFFESLYGALSSDLPIFICGDFNTVVNPYVDRFGCNPTSQWAYNWSPALTNLMASVDLGDAWRMTHPDISEFTWCRKNHSQKSRIDMIWLPRNMIDRVKTIEILPFFRSDHSYVFMKFSPPKGIERGPGLWKFNCSHLQDEAFCSKIVEFWTEWRKERTRFSRLSSWWDAGKFRLKRIIRQFSKNQANKHRQTVRTLNAALFHVQRRINDGENLLELLDEIKTDLATELQKEAQGVQLRASVQWAEEGESSTTYFLRQEKTSGKRRLIGRIKRTDGSIAQDTKSILNVWRDFYFDLYTSIPLDETDQTFFLQKLERQLSPQEAQSCEGLVNEQECLRALKGMSLGKSPGIDGFPAEFYLRFWDTLGPDLVEVLNSCYCSGQLSPTQRSGIITLLFKKGNHLDTKNWRPITLLLIIRFLRRF